jgi:hypothetical protein
MSLTTWQLVLDAKGARKAFFRATRDNKAAVLRLCFAGWSATGIGAAPALATYNRAVSNACWWGAVALSHIQQLGRSIRSAVKDDKCAWLLAKTVEVKHDIDNGSSKLLWQMVRGVSGKSVRRRLACVMTSADGAGVWWLRRLGSPARRPR